MQGFDRAALSYSDDWDARPLVGRLRARVLARFLELVPPPARVADLGCGIGTDARLLVAAGYTVDAVDPSPGMVAEARRRGTDARVGTAADLVGPLDGVLSDFGALNLAPDLDAVAAALARVVRPSGGLVLVVMGPHCPVETLALLARGRLRDAWGRRGRARVPVAGAEVPVRWWSPAEVRRAFAGAFVPLGHEALGALVAPPDLGGRPGWRLDLEEAVATWPGVRGRGDHTLHRFTRR